MGNKDETLNLKSPLSDYLDENCLNSQQSVLICLLSFTDSINLTGHFNFTNISLQCKLYNSACYNFKLTKSGSEARKIYSMALYIY